MPLALSFQFHRHCNAAYERSNPVNNFQTSPTNQGCDPVHIVVGDAGVTKNGICDLRNRNFSVRVEC